MTKAEMPAMRSQWRVGQRVSRKDTGELGTVVAQNGVIKVHWDGGRTSYYRHCERANVQAQEPPQK